MNKDAILATAIGLVLGLTIAGIFIFGPRFVIALPKLKVPTITAPKTAPKATPTATSVPKEFGITISAPLPDTVEPNQDVIVSGRTAPGATVVIQGGADEDVVVAGPDGAYAGKVTATESKNDISVTAYTADKQAQASVTIYFTQERF